jgi:predicted amidohydrolase YtcJ
MDKAASGYYRWGVLAVVLAGAALSAVACGGSSSPALAGETAYQKALAYSQCMRAHGEPGFPDPQSNGGVLIDAAKDHLNGALMNSANKACQHLLPKQHQMTAAQQRQVTARVLKYVACMRAHGLTSMPDPQVNANGIGMRLPPGMSPSSPAFQSAQQACHKLIPGLPS